MVDIEKQYRSRLGQWSGQQRVMRTAELFSEMRVLLSHKVSSAHPELDQAEVRTRVAESLYRTDPETQRLLASLDR